MDTEDIAGNLRGLATATKNRTKIGRLRELYPDIEKAKAAGVSLEKVMETLNESGMSFTMLTFKNYLHRLRKEREAEEKQIPGGKPPVSATPKWGEVSTAIQATPDEDREDQAEHSSLSNRERREKKAGQYITAESSNPLLKNIQNKGTKK